MIAHSLGTAVAYESYHAMMTDGLDSVRLATAFRPDNVLMLANVIKPLWNRGGSDYPAVMAPTLSVDQGWCFRMALKIIVGRHKLYINRTNPQIAARCTG